VKRVIGQEPIKPVGIWIRVSTENQARGDSPEHHELRARHYAASRNWKVVELYKLEAVSGRSVMAHAETKRMIADVRAGRITGLIFSKLARLARNTKELLEFSDIFRECNADLVSLQESIDTSTPAGRLFYTMIAAMAQWEREEIVERINASITVRAKLGKPLCGQTSFGYVWRDKKLEPDPTEAPVRKLVYELFAEHRRKKAVARILNEMGHRTRNGSRFSDTTIDRLIRDPTAKGTHRGNYTKNVGAGKGWVLKSEEHWVWTPVEAIVSDELWNQCNQILEERKSKIKRPGRRPIHMFSGITYCHCGTKMYPTSKSPRYRCWTCGHTIATIDLEEIYYQQLKGYFLSPDAILKHLREGDQNIADREKHVATLRKEADKVEQEIQRIYKLYNDGGLTADGFGKFYRPLEERQKQLELELPRSQAELDVLKINHVSSDMVLTEAQNLYDRWPHLNRDEKQRVVESITDKIVVGKDEISINLCYVPSSEETTKRQRAMSDSSLPPS
jgi:site-specific DNA recombinase